MATLGVIGTSHSIIDGPATMLFHLKEQTRPPDRVYLGISDTPLYQIPVVPFPIFVLPDKNKEDFGYGKRRTLITFATTDYVTFVCHDDTYRLNYYEQAMKAIEREDYDVVYCAWNDIPDCTFRGGSSTLGNFIVRTKIAQEIGFPRQDSVLGEEGESDAALINELASRNLRIFRINTVSYFHNVPRFPMKVSKWGKLIAPVKNYEQHT